MQSALGGGAANLCLLRKYDLPVLCVGGDAVAFAEFAGEDFEAERVEDYDGRGKPMMVMTRPLPWNF